MEAIKRFIYIFIPILAILLMSHNANAISPVYDLSDYDRVYYGSYSQDCVFDDTSLNTTNVYGCYLFRSDKNLRVIKTNRTFDFLDGDIVTFDVVVISQTSLPLVIDLKGFNTEYPRMSLIDMNIIDGDYYYSGVSESLVPSGYTIRKVFRYTYRVNSDTNYSIGVGQSNQSNYSFTFADGSTSVSGFYLNFYLRDVTVWRSLGSRENQEQAEATQDAADEASSSGSSSAADAETATSSLISVIGGFVSVVTSATPTNCKIDADLNHIDMGNIDLCANPVPSYIQIIGSIILICVVIPLAIILFNRFIGLFRSFQG